MASQVILFVKGNSFAMFSGEYVLQQMPFLFMHILKGWQQTSLPSFVEALVHCQE